MSTRERSAGGRGFERAPRGALIDQLIESDTPMGIAYERSLAYYKAPHVHDRVILVFPRGASSMDVTVTRDRTKHRITRGEGLLVPADIEHDDRAVSSVYDTFALLPTDDLIRHAMTGDAKKKYALPKESVLFARTPWMDALLDEYFAERVLGRHHLGPLTNHLESLIVFEVFSVIASATSKPLDRARIPGPSSLVARALRCIESNLFEPFDLERLARTTGASRSSLLRHFRSETGTTPLAYVRKRRLEEAETLLGRREYNVAEVARLVGYTSSTAFSEAYRAHFGVAPTARVARDRA